MPSNVLIGLYYNFRICRIIGWNDRTPLEQYTYSEGVMSLDQLKF